MWLYDSFNFPDDLALDKNLSVGLFHEHVNKLASTFTQSVFNILNIHTTIMCIYTHLNISLLNYVVIVLSLHADEKSSQGKKKSEIWAQKIKLQSEDTGRVGIGFAIQPIITERYLINPL